jgi:uncharacterized protein (TIGR03437 family)
VRYRTPVLRLIALRCEFVLFILLPSLFAAPAPTATSIPYFADQGSSPILAVALDPAGNIYIAGTTTGNIPLVNALQPKLGGGNCSYEPSKTFFPCQNIFVAKFDPTGAKLIYSTYLSGDQSDSAAGLVVDRDGNAYIAGTTQPAGPSLLPSGGGNAFVKKLNPTGSALLYTRYIGGDTSANGIAVDPNGNAYLVGYSLGGGFPSVSPLPLQPSVKSLYVSNDGGSTWRAINNGLSATNVNSLAVDPARPTTLYAATSGGVYKSADAGANWTHILPAATVGDTVVIDPRRPSTVYVTYGSGMYLARSTDAGATWATISDNFPPPSLATPFENIGAFAIDPGDSNVLWAIVSPNRFPTVIRSTDSGDHWQIVYTFPPDIFRSATLVGHKLLIDPKNSLRLYACCIFDPIAPGTGGVYRSDDGGKTWVQGATGPFGGSAGILSPWLDPRDSSVLYGDWYYGLQRSSDAGMTWAEVPLPFSAYGYEPGGLAVDASGTLYLLNDFGYLLRSSDGGGSWSKIDGPWAPLASILAIDPTNPSTPYVASGASFSTAGTPAQHAFAAKLDGSGAIQWATLFGGSGQDEAHAIALDSAGNAYITGKTNSDDFPTVNPFQAVRGRNTFPTTNAFVTKISADGSKLLYSSFLGGTGVDSGNAIAIDPAGNAYVAGGTQYGAFPVVAPLQPQPDNPNAASFLAKVDPTGGKLVYSTLLTGSGGYPTADQASAITVDAQGRAIVAGVTGDPTFPLINPIQPTFGLGSNFIARLAPGGNSLDFSTYLGDLHEDIKALALSPNSALWIAGTSGLARIDFQPPPAQPGVPLVLGVYNAASYRLGDVVAPGEIVTLIGEELAPVAQTTGPGSLPRMMQGVSVSIGGIAAPLFYVSPTQINFQVPVELPIGSASLVVQRGTQTSAARTVRIAGTAPGLFAASGDVRGPPAVVHANDFSLVTEQNPAHPGEYLAAFCTGLGATDPAATSGEPATAAAPIKAAIFAQIDSGAELPILYAGLAPGWVGLYQINFRLSEGETPGRKQLLFLIDYNPTNQAPIWVQ